MRTRTTSPSINIHTDVLYCKCSLLWAGFKSVRIHLLYISLSLSQFLISFSLSLSHPFLCFCPLYCSVSLPQPSVGAAALFPVKPSGDMRPCPLDGSGVCICISVCLEADICQAGQWVEYTTVFFAETQARQRGALHKLLYIYNTEKQLSLFKRKLKTWNRTFKCQCTSFSVLCLLLYG